MSTTIQAAKTGNMRATLRPVKGLLLTTAVLIVLTIIMIFNARVTRTHAGHLAVASSISSPPASQSSSAAFPVWVSPSLVRVGKADAPGTASSISLSSARCETVDTQVIVQGPAGGLTNVNVSASALPGPGGASLPAANVTLYREYYITVTGTANYGGGSNPPPRSGPYTAPLLPFNHPEAAPP